MINLVFGGVSVLFVATVIHKITHWNNFIRETRRKQPLKILYTQTELDGTSSKERRAFMKTSNLISASIGITLLTTMLVYIWDAYIRHL